MHTYTKLIVIILGKTKALYPAKPSCTPPQLSLTEQMNGHDGG